MTGCPPSVLSSLLPSLTPKRLWLCTASLLPQGYSLCSICVPGLISVPATSCCSMLASPRRAFLVTISCMLSDLRQAVVGPPSPWRGCVEAHWPSSYELLMSRRNLLSPSVRLFGSLVMGLLRCRLSIPILLSISELLCVYLIHGLQMLNSNKPRLALSALLPGWLRCTICDCAAGWNDLWQALLPFCVSWTSQEQQLLPDLLMLHRVTQRCLSLC